jgi:hypothetical protein
MTMRSFRHRLLLVFSLALTPLPLAAAEFRINANAKDCEIQLQGDIVRGDLDKLKSQLPDGMGPGKAGPTMCLNSKGGDFMEGLKLAKFVSDGIATKIKAGSSCESACGWIFMAGSHYDTGGSQWSRGMDSRATLSFHAPFIDPASLASIGSQAGSITAKAIIEAYSRAVSELSRGLLQLAQQHASTTGQILVSPALLSEALVKVGDQKLLVDTTGAAIRWSINIGGYAGVVPRSKTDVIRACVVASAFGNEFWNDDFLSITEAEEYEAYYDSRSRTLVAEMVVEGLAHVACELEFKFDQSLLALKDGTFTATINVGSYNSVTKSWIRDRYAAQNIVLSDLAVLAPNTLLNHLVRTPGAPLNPHSLATLSPPSWCSAQPMKTPDEKAVCDTSRLTTYDIFLADYYNQAIANSDAQAKSKLQSEQRAWLARRRSCNDEVQCISQAYHSRIAALK